MFEKAIERELSHASNGCIPQNSRRGAPYQVWRDRQAQLIDQTGLSKLSIPRWAALSQHDGGTAAVELIDHRSW